MVPEVHRYSPAFMCVFILFYGSLMFHVNRSVTFFAGFCIMAVVLVGVYVIPRRKTTVCISDMRVE